MQENGRQLEHLNVARLTWVASSPGREEALGRVDSPFIDSTLAADLMEPVRPLVDRYVLRLLEGRTFAMDDFYETRQGVCRVTPPLAQELVATLPEWRQAVGLVVEDVARLLDDGDRPAERCRRRSVVRTGARDEGRSQNAAQWRRRCR